MNTVPFHRLCAKLFLPLGLALATVCLPFRAAAQSPITLIDLDTHIWLYDDSGSDLGTDWRIASYPAEAAWKTGAGLLGEDPTAPYPYPSPIRTRLTLGGGRMTYYFRAHFNVATNPTALIVTGTAYVDDGAVFYANGAEVARVRLTNSPAYFTNRAQLASPEGIAFQLGIPSSALVAGDNVLAVEVHQNALNGSDIIFGLGLQATLAEFPVVLDTNEPADRVVLQGESTVLAVAGSGNPPPSYAWYRNGVAVPGGNGPSLALNNVGSAEAGAYYVVLANSVGSTTSRVAQVDYVPDTNGPVALYAIGYVDPTQEYPNKILVVFNEPLDENSATDAFSWDVLPPGGINEILSAELFNRTNVLITTYEPRTEGIPYFVARDMLELLDLFGNPFPIGSNIPVALFTNSAIALNQSWHYEQSAADLGASWRSNSFNDAGWNNGPAPLDAFRSFPDSEPPLCRPDFFINGDLVPVGTCLSLSNANNSAQITTHYFRTHFNFSGDAAHTVLQLEALVDDGAIFYLNGAELCRLGMAAGPADYNTTASRIVTDLAFETLLLSGAGLQQGDNVLAVELHQDSSVSPDATFAVRVAAITPEPPAAAAAAPPRLGVSHARDEITVSWVPSVGTLQSSDKPSGPWSEVASASLPSQHREPISGARKFFRVVVP